MICPVTARTSGPPAPRLAGIRSRWLAAATANLRADPDVLGAALIGSLGTGRADDWSDIDSLPLWVDRYVYPASWAAWPADSTVLSDRRGIGRLALTFAQHMDAVERNQPAPRDPDQRRALQAALIPIAGKYIARRSPDTPRLIELTGGPRTHGGIWAGHLATLRQLLDGHAAAGAGTPQSIAATHAYLDIVAATLD
jgi:hypothetical protein